MIAPEPRLTALLEIVYLATLRARALGSSAPKDPDSLSSHALSEIADLMDAIHNIPLHLAAYEAWNEEFFLLCLRCYDEKWSARSGLALGAIYQRALSGNPGPLDSVRSRPTGPASGTERPLSPS